MKADYAKLSAKAETAVKAWSDDWRYEYEERAAIKEYDAGMPRDQAQYEAFLEIKRKKDAAR